MPQVPFGGTSFDDQHCVMSVQLVWPSGQLTPEAADLISLLRQVARTDRSRTDFGDRRSGGGPVRDAYPSIAYDDCTVGDPTTVRICPASRTVSRAGRQISLTRLEFDLLTFLAEHPYRVFTRTQLLDHVWGDRYAGPRTVDVHVRRLRVKIGADTPVVLTVRGIGYRLGDAIRADILS